MGKLVVSENITLDGVVGDPTWAEQILGEDRTSFAAHFSAEAEAAGAMLLGRRTYEYFTDRWLDRAGPWADRLRELPKYVVTSNLDDRGWGKTTAVTVDDVPELKRTEPGEIVVNGSRRLAQALLERGLVDEVRLLVFPVVAGEGERLFGPGPATRFAGGLLPLSYPVAPA